MVLNETPSGVAPGVTLNGIPQSYSSTTESSTKPLRTNKMNSTHEAGLGLIPTLSWSLKMPNVISTSSMYHAANDPIHFSWFNSSPFNFSDTRGKKQKREKMKKMNIEYTGQSRPEKKIPFHSSFFVTLRYYTFVCYVLLPATQPLFSVLVLRMTSAEKKKNLAE